MDNIVEATSLSHVTNIAANPPLDPNAPADIPRLPLVLYIARVPGSRDVFLTPIKPRDKVVSAQDVQSSLYYVHVNCTEDFEAPPQRPSSVNADASTLLPIPEAVPHRKPPLPARPSAPLTPPYPVDDHFMSDRPQALPTPKTSLARKPVGGRNHDVSTPVQGHALPALPRRPLPSPPLEERPPHTSLRAENVRLLRRSDHSEENNPYQRQYEFSPRTIHPDLIPDPGSLTLIRRDPMSNEQWNVASIHDPPVQEVSSAALLNPNVAKRTRKGGAPLYLDIANPAYMQFTDLERPVSRTSTSSVSSEGDPPPDGVFRRRLYMPGSKYSDHMYGHQRNSSSVGSFEQTDDISMRRSMRHSADMSVSSSAPSVDRRSKRYSFKSPWDSQCEFATGTTGKSLRCKHYWPSHNVQEVSELRFNLPTKSSKSATVLSEKRSSYFHRHGRSHSSVDENETPTFMINEDGRLDLTLGQERAGGGFGGKQAKLGKLIIEPEGLKMLDLLVAANIGLWWRAYERL